MGLLDELARGIGAQLGKGAGNEAVNAALNLLNNPELGGMAGLVKLFNQGGLEKQMASWIGTGKNLPVSADQIMSVLGQGRVAELAKQAGVGSQDIAGGLAQMLPQIIDKLTPDGKLPAQNDLAGQLSKLAGALLRK
jgi:uncharacterized protein YidB (DUF937 family)